MGSDAPGRLGLIQDFVNTRELDPVRDALTTAEDLTGWLGARGLLREGRAGEPELRLALEVREALRRLLFANNGGVARGADVDLLNRAAAESGLRPRFLAGGRVDLEPDADGARGALGRLLAAVSAAMHDGTWSRLKACADDGCQWAFYDRSKNHSGHWCSMESCGNRAKARQFRQRRRAGNSN
jgi:predicted RNA-binding Zn ribbon-like protein